MWDALEWISSGLGIAGAATNSVGGRLLRLTWPLWLASNLLGFAVLTHMHAHGFLAQQIAYTATTLIGGFRAFFPRRWQRIRDACARQYGLFVKETMLQTETEIPIHADQTEPCARL